MAAAVIGALRVNLGIDSAAFGRGLKDSESGLKRFAANAAKGIAVAAAAFAAAAAGIGLAVRGVLNEADQMGKVAQSLGVPVDELSRLKHAAEMSGSSLEGLSPTLRRLGANIMESVSKPTSAAGKAFNALGIDLKNTDGSLKNSSQVMSDLAEKLSQMPDGAEKTALAMQLMGRSGADLIPMLNGGRDALQAMKDEADALGIVIDQKTATAAANFNDNLTRLSRMLSGVWTKLTAELAPALAAMTGYFVDAAKESGGFGSAISRAAQTAIDGALWVIDAWHGLKVVFPALEVAATGFAHVVMEIARTVANAVTAMVDGMLSRINAGVREMNALTGLAIGELKTLGETEWFANSQRQSDEAAMSFARARLRLGMLMNEPLPSEGIRQAIAAMDEVKVSSTAAAGSFADAMQAVEAGTQRAAAGASAAAREFAQLSAEGERVRLSVRTPVEELQETFSRLSALLEKGAIDWETYSRAVDQAQQRFDEAKNKGDQLASTLSGQFSSMFEGLISGTRSAGEAIRGLLKQLGQMLINKAFQMLFAGMGGGGGGGSFLDSLFGGFRADGGPVSAGKAYMVGERGPELVIPRANGMVIPNHDLQGGSASPVKVDITVSPSGEFDARVANVADSRAQVTVRAYDRQLPGRISSIQKRGG